ncbi:MAG: hypothetical protein ACR2RL_06535 [Gammaproteobacteria bacterium]
MAAILVTVCAGRIGISVEKGWGTVAKTTWRLLMGRAAELTGGKGFSHLNATAEHRELNDPTMFSWCGPVRQSFPSTSRLVAASSCQDRASIRNANVERIVRSAKREIREHSILLGEASPRRPS